MKPDNKKNVKLIKQKPPHNQGSLYYQPKQCTFVREIPQNYHIFALFGPPKMGNLMTPENTPPRRFTPALGIHDCQIGVLPFNQRHATEWKLSVTSVRLWSSNNALTWWTRRSANGCQKQSHETQNDPWNLKKKGAYQLRQLSSREGPFNPLFLVGLVLIGVGQQGSWWKGDSTGSSSFVNNSILWRFLLPVCHSHGMNTPSSTWNNRGLQSSHVLSNLVSPEGKALP